jgi:hypothetical protein
VKSDSINLFIILRITVIAKFILHIEQYEDTAGNTDGQSHEVNKRVAFIPLEIAKCSFNVIF